MSILDLIGALVDHHGDIDSSIQVEMTDKGKSISCLVLSGIGWLILVIGFLYEKYSPGANEFSPLIDYLVYILFSIAASLIHLLNCIYAVIFLLRRARHRIFCVLGLLSSVSFVIFCSIPLLVFLCTPSDKEESLHELDMRWTEYTRDQEYPTREIQLNQNTSSLVFSKSPADQKALSGSCGGANIDCFDLPSGEHLLSLESHKDSVQSLSFSPDGNRALSGGSDGEIILWDIEKGVEIGRWKAHVDYVRSVSCSPGGNQVLSGGDDGRIFLWDLNTMQLVKTFEGHTSGFRSNCLVWGQDGRTFLSGSRDGSIRLWDVQTGDERVHLQAGYGRVMSIALSPDGKYALSSYLSGPDQPVIYWNLETRQEINRFGVPGNPWHADQKLDVESVAFSSDGKTALFGLVFGTVIWWDLNEWKPISMNRLFEEHLAYVSFSKDDHYCIAAGCDEDTVTEKAKIRYWELKR